MVKLDKNKVISGIVCSVLVAGVSVCSTANFVVSAEELNSVGVYEYSQKCSDDISSLLENKKGVIYVKDRNAALQDSVSLTEESDETEETDMSTINAVSFGEYYYMDGDKVCSCDFYGTEYTNEAQLSALVERVKNCIEEASGGVSVCSTSGSASISVGSAWERIKTERIPYSMDYNSVHYGDYLEIKSSYYMVDGDLKYYAINKKCYITPNSDESVGDFRASSLSVTVKALADQANDGFHEYDYMPKTQGPTANISESMEVEVSTEKIGVTLGLSVSKAISSPSILSQGNISNDKIKILYEYTKITGDTNDAFVKYSKAETMQPVIGVFFDTDIYADRYTKEGSVINIYNATTGKTQGFGVGKVNYLY